MWEEIQEKLGPEQDALERPDITGMVFDARQEALLHNLRFMKP
jgi:hypothetical protein